MPSPLARHWTLDPDVTFLNHGSYGACPREVLERQSALRSLLEREPVRFMQSRYEPLLEAARASLAAFVGGAREDLVFVANATVGVNAVLRSLDFGPGDELLTTDHAYNACANALAYVAGRTGAKVVVAKVPFPLRDPGEVTAAVLGAITPRTRLLLLDHVTSPTGLVFPVAEIVRAAEAAGVRVLVDGAHAAGMVPLDIGSIGASYYTGNLHKWTCTPKGAAFLHVRRDRQAEVRPLAISHGANSPRTDRSRFQLEFDWTGTLDPTAFLVLPDALRVMGSLVPGGWDEIRARNRAFALAAQERLARLLGVEAPAPASLIGSLAALPLPEGDAAALHAALFDRYRIELPVMPWPAPPKRLLRVAAQVYLAAEDVDRLCNALGELGLARGSSAHDA